MTKKYQVIEIHEQATIFNSDGSTTQHEAIQITPKGIHIGNIAFKPKTDLLNLDISCKKKSTHTCFNAYEEFEKTYTISKKNVLEIDSKYKRSILLQQ